MEGYGIRFPFGMETCYSTRECQSSRKQIVSGCTSVVKKQAMSVCTSVVKKQAMSVCTSVVKKQAMSVCTSVVKEKLVLNLSNLSYPQDKYHIICLTHRTN